MYGREEDTGFVEAFHYPLVTFLFSTARPPLEPEVARACPPSVALAELPPYASARDPCPSARALDPPGDGLFSMILQCIENEDICATR